MSGSVKVSGTYRPFNALHVRVGGVWKRALQAYVRVGGVWKPFLDINFWGLGSDGSLNTSGNVSLPSTTDGDVIVKQYTDLTINAGHTLTVSNRCKGLLVYVNGNCTINGTLSMTARGAAVDPVAAGVSASGLRFRRRKTGGTSSDSSTNLLAGCGTAAVDAENLQAPLSSDGNIYSIARAGASGSAGGSNPGGGA
jgi:hypothetical protein